MMDNKWLIEWWSVQGKLNSLQAERTQEESRMQVLEESLGRLLEDKLQNLKAVIRPNPDLVHGNIEKINL